MGGACLHLGPVGAPRRLCPQAVIGRLLLSANTAYSSCPSCPAPLPVPCPPLPRPGSCPAARPARRLAGAVRFWGHPACAALPSLERSQGREEARQRNGGQPNAGATEQRGRPPGKPHGGGRGQDRRAAGRRTRNATRGRDGGAAGPWRGGWKRCCGSTGNSMSAWWPRGWGVGAEAPGGPAGLGGGRRGLGWGWELAGVGLGGGWRPPLQSAIRCFVNQYWVRVRRRGGRPRLIVGTALCALVGLTTLGAGLPIASAAAATQSSFTCSSFGGLAAKVIHLSGCTDKAFTGGDGITGGALATKVKWTSGRSTQVDIEKYVSISKKLCPSHPGWTFKEANTETGVINGGDKFTAELCIYGTSKGWWIQNVPKTLVHF